MKYCFLLFTAALWAQSPTINELPTREFGQPKLQIPLTSGAINLVEGREFNNPGAIAFDTSVSPPILYVADTSNHRILAWKNPAGLSKGNFADKVIGQRDFSSTLPLGPGTTFSIGLTFPSGVAVDRSGNLYVADAGNNRILRYPAPFRQIADLTVDLVIGQKSVSSGNSANEGLGTPSEKTLSLINNGIAGGLAFDLQQNLWVADAGNNRVLRFPAANLAANTLEPAADLVLGQDGFVTRDIPQGQNQVQTNKVGLIVPSALAFDARGGLYVADGFARVLYYQQPQALIATRVLGIRPTPAQGKQPSPYPTDSTLGLYTPQGQLVGSPQGLFTIGNNVFVCDTPVHRIVYYDLPENWPAATETVPSPPIAGVVTGQPDATSSKVNRGLKEPDNTSLVSPGGGAFNGTDMWIVDSGNHRVLSFPQAGSLTFSPAVRVLGQLDFGFNTPNLIEGREVWVSAGGFSGASLAVDRNSTPPRLYLADPFNNRVLGFKDARLVGTDTRTLLTGKADLVIGQPDVFRSLINYPGGDPLVLNDSGLFRPIGLAVDKDGSLFVADSGNGRILRFPSPFSQPPGTLPHANLVLGQRDFASKIQDATGITMRTPFGLALFSDGSLAASDVSHNRILLFKKPAGGDFTNGQFALSALGQNDLSSSASGNTLSNLNGTRNLATDSSDRLYAADTLNSRLLVFTQPLTAGNGPAATFQLPLSQPQGVAVSFNTGEIWVTNTGGNLIYRLPEFQILQLNPTQFTAQLQSVAPLALSLDPFDNLIVAEASNRISFYFGKLTFRHAASFNQRSLAPGMLAYLARLGSDFALTPDQAAVPYPKVLSDLQVTVNGTLAPIFRVLANRIDFQVPQAPVGAIIPSSAEVVVSRPSSGQILAVATLPMAKSNPGLFTFSQDGRFQAAAVNVKENSGPPECPFCNGNANRVARGNFFTLFLTGQGPVENAPPDGAAPGGALPTPVAPVVIINTGPVPTSDIQFSGLSPEFPGLWQINVRVPETTPPGAAIAVIVTMYDVQSNVIGSAAGDGFATVGNGLITTIAVK